MKRISEQCPLLPRHFLSESVAHFRHACRKHPYFADMWYDKETKYPIDSVLRNGRDKLARSIKTRTVDVCKVLEVEIAEALQEVENGNTDLAIQECYDSIAVLMRMICVLDGSQTFGDQVIRNGRNHGDKGGAK